MKKDQLLETFKDSKIEKNQLRKLNGGLVLAKCSAWACTQIANVGSDDFEVSIDD